jgi:hypothetical protein
MGPSQELCPHTTAQRKRRGLSPDNVTNFALYASVTETDAITSIMNNIFWSLTLREERRLRVFENRLLKKIFGPTMDEIKRTGRDCRMRSFMICTPHEVLFGWSNQEE